MEEVVGPVESLGAFVGVIHNRNHIAVIDISIEDKTAFVEFLDIDTLFALEAELAAAASHFQISVLILRLEDTDGIDEFACHHAIGEVSHIKLARLDFRMRALFV